MIKVLLAALFLLSSRSFAEDTSVEGRAPRPKLDLSQKTGLQLEPAKPVEDREPVAGPSGPSGAGPGGNLPWEVYKNIQEMPLRQGAHGGMRFTRNSGYSVGFIPGPEGFAPNCTVTSTPLFVGQGCRGRMWISETPGGPALEGTLIPAMLAQMATAGYIQCVTTSGKAVPGIDCRLPPGNKRFYCNVVVSMSDEDWMGVVPDENGVIGRRKRTCEAVVSSPLGYPENLPRD